MSMKEKRPLPPTQVVNQSCPHYSGIVAGQYNYIVEYLHVLLATEARPQYTVCCDYLSLSHGGNAPEDTISDTGRCKMCEWCYSIVDHFDVDREVVSIAMNYLDRHAAIISKEGGGSSISNRDFQLFAVTSLFLAIKLHGDISVGRDGLRMEFRVGMMSDLTSGTFSVAEIEASERSVLVALEWFTHPPTAIQFVRNMVALFPDYTSSGCHLVDPHALLEIFEIARYVTELSVCAGYLSINFEPSVIAFAAILCAIDELDGDVLAIKHGVRVEFLANVKLEMNLFPGMEIVEEVHQRLGTALFQSSAGSRRNTREPKILVTGIMSPVSVVQGPIGENKRRRVTP